MSSAWWDDLERRARAALPAPLFEYVDHGSGEQLTRREASDGWRGLRLRAHVLRDVTEVDLSTRLLDHDYAVPWGIAPTSLQRAVHPDGELATARASATAEALMVVSSNAGTTFAEIGATGVGWWLQLYLPADRTLAEPLLDRAVAAGARAVVLTVDTPVVASWRPSGDLIWDVVDPAIVRTNFDPGYADAGGAEKALDLGPHDIVWLRERTGLPVVVKGVLRADDAVRCVQAGARAVWVSNHGGRQLDRAISTAEALPAVVAAVGSDAQVYVDGGVRCGLDVLSAAALGADAVLVGRTAVHALVEGADGVARMHAELGEQCVEAWRLAGCRTMADARDLAGPSRSTPS